MDLSLEKKNKSGYGTTKFASQGGEKIKARKAHWAFSPAFWNATGWSAVSVLTLKNECIWKSSFTPTRF